MLGAKVETVDLDRNGKTNTPIICPYLPDLARLWGQPPAGT